MSHARVHGGVVHVHHCLTLIAIGFKDGFLHIPGRVLCRDDICNFEKCRLEHGVCTASQPQPRSNAHGINDVKVNLLVRNCLPHIRGQMAVQLLFLPVTGKQQAAALL